jgi:hypothetical protein
VSGSSSPVDGLAGLVHGLSYFFCFLYLINRGGQQIASDNRPFTVTFDPRQLRKLPRLISFARLGKDYYSSDQTSTHNRGKSRDKCIYE